MLYDGLDSNADRKTRETNPSTLTYDVCGDLQTGIQLKMAYELQNLDYV